jgi:tRNA(fMet)-specific endonuclease VapC
MSQPGERGLLDTNTVILLNRLSDPSFLPQRPLICTITLAELSVGPLVTDDPQQRAARQAHLQLAESSFRPLPFDAAAARRFGGVAASLRSVGRKPAARAYDALIAAVALANDLPIYTVNPSDFEGIDGLTVRAVPHPDAGV